MTGQAIPVITREMALPLRIFGGHENKYLVCPFELTFDDITLSHYKGDPTVAHIQAISVQTPLDKGGFRRNFLYSRAGDEHVLTASGYIFDGPVRVLAPHTLAVPVEDLDDRAAAQLAVLKQTDLLHVRGDDSNITGGLIWSAEKHYKRLADLRPEEITLDEALEFYTALREHVPRQ